MASLFSRATQLARSPQGQKVIAQASTKAKQLANDPKTRAKIDQGTARVRAEVSKRRRPGDAGQGPGAAGPRPAGDDVTPR